MQDIKERLDLFPSNMNEPSQKAYCELFDYLVNLEQQVQKQKEVIDKTIEYIKEHIKYECDAAYNGMQFYSYHLYDFDKQELLDILQKV